MPIGDLLATIEGKPSTSSTITAVKSCRVLAKRKAEDDTKGSAPKTPRPGGPASSSMRRRSDSFKSIRLADRPSSKYTGSGRPSTATNARVFAEKSVLSASKKSSSIISSKPVPAAPAFSASDASSSTTLLSSKVAKSQAGNSVPTSTKVPKKGSYAEIKARAAAQAQKLQTIGKIQHKAVEKRPSKKEQEAAAAEEAKLARKGIKQGSKIGTAMGSKATAAGVPAVDERKPKKAALATTGYSGSARPPPSKAKPGPSKMSAAGGRGPERDKRPNPMGMFGSRRRRDEDYDEDMDDFIDDDDDDDDDEEDGYAHGARFRYADDDDPSDMEAGYSDVEDEETQAARLARLEDAREEAKLEKLRRQKEARKKAASRR